MNFVRGAVNFSEDWRRVVNDDKPAGAESFRVGHEVAITPGKIVFRNRLNETMRKAPLRRTIDACEVGRAALLLASDYTTAITGEILYVDAGFHIEGMVFH